MASIEEPSVKVSGEPQQVKACNLFKVDLPLRLLLLVAAVAAPVLMVTGGQTVNLGIPNTAFSMTVKAKYNYSPAFLYLVVALVVAAVYSLVTTVVSALSISKPSPPVKLLFNLALFDMIMLGLVASATGAGGAVGYIGLRGNKHTGWMKFCSIYGEFCHHIGASLVVSLLASIILVILVTISAYSLYRRSS